MRAWFARRCAGALGRKKIQYEVYDIEALLAGRTFIRAAQRAFTTPGLPERAALCSGVSRQRSR